MTGIRSGMRSSRPEISSEPLSLGSRRDRHVERSGWTGRRFLAAPSNFADGPCWIATKDQFTAALALLELDGVARRLILYPHDLSAEHVLVRRRVDAGGCDRFGPDGAEDAEVWSRRWAFT